MNSILWIATSIVVALTLIVILFVRQGKKQAAIKKQKLMDALQDAIEEKRLNIEYQDILHNRIIALDIKKRMLAFVDWQNDIPHVTIIDIEGLNNCNLLRLGNKITEQTKSGKKISEEYVTELQLEFISKSGTVNLIMYSEMVDGILEKQVLNDVANKWQQRIKGLIS